MALEADRHDCPDAEQLAAYADGNLVGGERREVEEHLVNCADCRSVWFEATVAVREPAAVSQEPPSRHWPVRRITAVVLAAAALCLAVTIEWNAISAWREPPDPPGAQAWFALVDRVPENRLTEGRLTGDFPYAPAPSPRRSGTGDSDSAAPSMRIAVAALERDAMERPSAQSSRNLALGYLAAHYVDRAITTFEQLRASRPDDAEIASDASAAYLWRARRDGSVADYHQARDAAESSLQLDPRLAPAAFNRAAAIEGLGMKGEAVAAWRHAAELDPHTPWATEAQARAEALERTR